LQPAFVEHSAPTLPAVQVLVTVGQSALVAHALPSMLHLRFWAGQSAVTEHVAPVIEHFLTAAQSVLVSQAVVVTIEQLPAFGQVPDEQALPVRSQVPPTFGQAASFLHCAPLMLQLPSGGQFVPAFAVVHEVPVAMLQ
jgi:hypothetical protein